MTRQGRKRRDAGFSLIELLVTVIIFGIVSTIIITFSINTTRTFTLEQAATDSTNIASLGMNELTRVIRSGTEIEVLNQTLNNPTFVTARNEELVMYAFLDTDSLNPAPIKVRFYITSGRVLNETRWASYKINTDYWAFQTTAASTRAICRLISPRVSPKPYLFSYYLADGTLLPVPTTGDFTTAQLRTIASVKVSLSVQADLTKRANAVELQNTVGIPNLGISRVVPG